MNRLWLGLCILAILLALGSVTTYGMGQICTPISDKLSSAAELVQNGQWQQACDLSHQAQKQWEQWHDLTASVTDHEPMEEVDALFAAQNLIFIQFGAVDAVTAAAFYIFAKQHGNYLLSMMLRLYTMNGRNSTVIFRTQDSCCEDW